MLLPSLRSYIRVTVIYHKTTTQCLDDVNPSFVESSEPGRPIWSLIVAQPSLIHIITKVYLSAGTFCQWGSKRGEGWKWAGEAVAYTSCFNGV